MNDSFFKKLIHDLKQRENGSYHLKCGHRYLGKLFVNDHHLVGCEFLNHKNLSGMRELCLWQQPISMEFVEEKKEHSFEFSLTGSELWLFYGQVLKLHLIAKKFQPPLEASMQVCSGTLYQDGEKSFSEIEFEVLSSILDHKKVSEIYDDSRFSNDEVTLALMSLKKNRFISLKKDN